MASPGKTPEVRVTGYRWVILALTAMCHAGGGAATQGLPTLAAFYQRDLQLAKAQVGLFNSAMSLGLVISLGATGWLSDRFGTRRVVLVGLLSIGCAITSVSFARSFEEAMLLLFLTGIASGAPNPAAARAVLYWFPVRSRGFAMGLQRTGLPLMGALAAAILPSVALAFGWRAALVALASAVMLLGLAVFAFYRESPSSHHGPARTEARPGNPWGLLRNRSILLASGLPAVLVAVQFSLVNYLVLYLTESLGAPVVVAGGALALTQLGGVAGRVFWGVLSDRIFGGSRRGVMMLVGVLSSLLLAAMGFLPPGVPLWTVTLLSVTLGLLTLGWHGVYTIMIPELVGKESAGSAVGFGYTLLQLGSFAGPPIFGYLVDITGDYRWSWRALALVAALGTALLVLLKERANSE